ncbi:MAG: maleylacetoacetate isomerase [Rhizomicrobium sp.]|nr:maleylacetoacetate isomerase [Rhizomicrobium sp.]
MGPQPLLYTYYRSSAAWRVRIALALKGLPYEAIPIHLRKHEQEAPRYRALNPQGLVPMLQDGDHFISQSIAIIEYLDEVHPQPPLLPSTALARARVRQLALTIACDIHPLNNLRVELYLKNQLGIDQAARAVWQRHWMNEGFAALETLLAHSAETGRYCHGDTPSLADLCLVPQLGNARRNDLDLSPYPTILAIEAACNAHPAFAAAQPARQADAE